MGSHASQAEVLRLGTRPGPSLERSKGEPVRTARKRCGLKITHTHTHTHAAPSKQLDEGETTLSKHFPSDGAVWGEAKLFKDQVPIGRSPWAGG